MVGDKEMRMVYCLLLAPSHPSDVVMEWGE